MFRITWWRNLKCFLGWHGTWCMYIYDDDLSIVPITPSCEFCGKKEELDEYFDLDYQLKKHGLK